MRLETIRFQYQLGPARVISEIVLLFFHALPLFRLV